MIGASGRGDQLGGGGDISTYSDGILRETLPPPHQQLRIRKSAGPHEHRLPLGQVPLCNLHDHLLLPLSLRVQQDLLLEREADARIHVNGQVQQSGEGDKSHPGVLFLPLIRVGVDDAGVHHND
eukprot:CAMPEP_0204432228 /NCGR_PEP_ID=MMETSP0470-20130426/66816_1 /ASSEMBLY_ACC=CAM_ASM_000385 /TAXON_ID=2969 /ORGANISM="Oxyrrhis marina" /LENGTH=123 /DNA_ID=CAMNT_0051430523 /DNA_START=347 /DNA_END=714 /DNA_ORIENTATION=-